MQLSAQTNQSNSMHLWVAMILATVGVFVTIAALNGGTALGTSAWDGLVTYLTNLLKSTWIMVLALVVLVVAVWQLAHGGGYKTLGVIIAVFAVALIGPGFMTTMSSTTAAPGSVTSAPGSVTSAPGSVTSAPGSVTTAPDLQSK